MQSSSMWEESHGQVGDIIKHILYHNEVNIYINLCGLDIAGNIWDILIKFYLFK